MTANAFIILAMLAAFAFVFVKASNLSTDRKLSGFRPVGPVDLFDDDHTATERPADDEAVDVRPNGLFGVSAVGVNPATGLSMVGDSMFDVAGNAFGTGTSGGAWDDHQSMTAMHDTGFGGFHSHGMEEF